MANDKIKITINADDKASRKLKGIGLNIISLNQGLEIARKAWDLVSDSMLSVLETSDKFRRYNILLKQVTGSTENAAKAMADLRKTARQTPATLATLTDSFVKLKSSGVEDAPRTLKALANAIAAFGGGDELFKRASIALQQMSGKGVISMEELRQQLGEAVPTALKIMSREMGMTMKDFVKQVSLGAVDAQEGITAMTRGFEKDFDGASVRMMDTWMGATSNLTDAWEQFLSALGETGILDTAIDAVQLLTEAIREMARIIKENQNFINTFFRNVARGFKAVIDPLSLFRTLPVQGMPSQARPDELPPERTFQTPKFSDKSKFIKRKIALLKEATAQEIELALFRAEELARIDMEAWEKTKEFDRLNKELKAELITDEFEKKRELIRQQFKAEKKMALQHDDTLEKLNKANQKRMGEIDKAEQNFRLSQAANFAGNMASAAATFAGQRSDAYRVLAHSQALISTYLAANIALASAPPPFNFILAAGVVAAGLANVQKINNAANQAHGGIDNVPRESTFLLQRGERVIQPEQNRDLTNFLAGQGGGGEGGSGNFNLHIENFNGNWNDEATDSLIEIQRRETALGFA